MQEKLIQNGGMGLVNPQNIFNTLEKYLENAGYKDATQFFNNPSTQPPQPPKEQQPDPALEIAKQDIQMRNAKNEADVQLKQQKQQQDNIIKMQRLNLDEQKLATQVIKDQNVSELEKEKLATKILEQGMN